jgi:hypothetical protein
MKLFVALLHLAYARELLHYAQVQPRIVTSQNKGQAYCSAYCGKNLNSELIGFQGACCLAAFDSKNTPTSCLSQSDAPLSCVCQQYNWSPFQPDYNFVDSRFVCQQSESRVTQNNNGQISCSAYCGNNWNNELSPWTGACCLSAMDANSNPVACTATSSVALSCTCQRNDNTPFVASKIPSDSRFVCQQTLVQKTTLNTNGTPCSTYCGTNQNGELSNWIGACCFSAVDANGKVIPCYQQNQGPTTCTCRRNDPIPFAKTASQNYLDFICPQAFTTTSTTTTTTTTLATTTIAETRAATTTTTQTETATATETGIVTETETATETETETQAETTGAAMMLSFNIQNVDWIKFFSSLTFVNSFKIPVQKTIAINLNIPFRSVYLQIGQGNGFISVQASCMYPPSTNLAAETSFVKSISSDITKSLVKTISAFPGFSRVTTGTISVTDFAVAGQ